MGTPVFAADRSKPAHPHRSPGIYLIVIGVALSALGVVSSYLFPPPFEGVAMSVMEVGFILAISGIPLVFTRWQFARGLGFCPACGAGTGRADKFCPRCGRRLW